MSQVWAVDSFTAVTGQSHSAILTTVLIRKVTLLLLTSLTALSECHMF